MKLANINIKLKNLHQMLQIYLSKRRKVESRQLASIQLPSFDIDIQLTGCPKSSDISLVHNEAKKKISCMSIMKTNYYAYIEMSNVVHMFQLVIS